MRRLTFFKGFVIGVGCSGLLWSLALLVVMKLIF